MSRLRSALPLLTVACAIAALYLYKLGGVGVLGPDEPRYAAIGQAMARTGDYITPRLWGSPWFEKPPLLYWMTAAGTHAGFGPEVAARLPVALLSLAFLVAAYFLIRREFGYDAAAASIILLATSAGWIAFSNLALTDLPLTAFFSLAVLLALPLLRAAPSAHHIGWRFAAIGACIGLAALAKGLVPIALAVPFAWFLRRYWRAWPAAFGAFAIVALPWYLAVYWRNGYPFIEELFIRHHFERLYSATLQHVQPWYYYFPVMLAALFPWTPLLGLIALRRIAWDARRQFLAAVSLFGFVLFSASLNKLPGYVLPLVPALFVLIGTYFEESSLARLPRAWLLGCALLAATIPLFARALPQALISGRFSLAAAGNATRVELFYIAAPVLVVLLARRSWTGSLLALCVVASGIYVKTVAFPKLDRDFSARWFSAQIKDLTGTVCDGGMNRDWIFGIGFYRNQHLEPCGSGRFDFAIRSQAHSLPTVEPLRR